MDGMWGYCSGCRRFEPVEEQLIINHATWTMQTCSGSGEKPSPLPGPDVNPDETDKKCACAWTGPSAAGHIGNCDGEPDEDCD